ncbi:hypothetical protein AURDEDRAFT_173803 [Auricularia subglabra TFB-10046 SS5]|nr:hypothetical protein AURDEDRAFT_173803 [Auricularia subglabra TFB-10046 SS5]
MSRSALLLQHLLPALLMDARDRVQQSSFSSDWKSSDAVDELCDDAVEQFQDAILRLKRTHNASLPHAKLPAEVWCIVWSFLPDEYSVVCVTHVCSAWRTIATGYAQFWTHVRFWTTVHTAGGSCDDKMCECPTDEQLHNMDKVATWLGRSKAAPITMDVCVHPVFSEHKLARRLAKIVRPHAHRITDLICEFGDVSFFIDFMQRAKQFDSLRLLRMRRMTYLLYEDNTWPFSKLRLDEIHVPQLQEFRGYCDFQWDITGLPGAAAFSVLQSLRCAFVDARTMFDCLRCCPCLVFLNAELCDLPATALPPTPSKENETLSPQLAVLILDRMTPHWAALIAPLIHRAALKSLILRYMFFAAETLFSPLTSLSGALYLEVSFDDYDVTVDATDEQAHSRHLEFHVTRDATRGVRALGYLWRALHSCNLATLSIAWPLRAALLNTSLRASQLSRIKFTISHDDIGNSGPSIADLLALNDAAEVGQPHLPKLSTLVLSSRGNHSLSAAPVKEYATALSNSVLSIELDGVNLA